MITGHSVLDAVKGQHRILCLNAHLHAALTPMQKQPVRIEDFHRQTGNQRRFKRFLTGNRELIRDGDLTASAIQGHPAGQRMQTWDIICLGQIKAEAILILCKGLFQYLRLKHDVLIRTGFLDALALRINRFVAFRALQPPPATRGTL